VLGCGESLSSEPVLPLLARPDRRDGCLRCASALLPLLAAGAVLLLSADAAAVSTAAAVAAAVVGAATSLPCTMGS
jgi:hypothetical protein